MHPLFFNSALRNSRVKYTINLKGVYMENHSLTERNYFRESHLITNAKVSYTSSEIDLIMMLLTSVKKEDKDFKDYVFSVQELEKKAGKKINHTQLKDTAKSLMSKVIEIQESPKKWKLFTWFSSFSYDDGIVTCSFHKDLKPYLLELQGRFDIANIKHLLPMKSSYSKRIYMLIKERSKFGSRTFDINEMMELLKVPKSHKERYNKFKTDVLIQAKNDINKYTDLEVDFEEIKPSRKVTGVTFIIKKNYVDLKTFIEFIRELHANELLYYSKDNRPLKCSLEGLLYYADDMATLDKSTAQKAWEFLHEKREKLLCFQPSLLD